MTEPLHDASGAVVPGRQAQGEPHGRAALLLVESLLHMLIARSVISIADVIEIVATAIDVETELAEEAMLADIPDTTTAALLERIVSSFALDLPRGATPVAD